MLVLCLMFKFQMPCMLQGRINTSQPATFSQQHLLACAVAVMATSDETTRHRYGLCIMDVISGIMQGAHSLNSRGFITNDKHTVDDRTANTPISRKMFAHTFTHDLPSNVATMAVPVLCGILSFGFMWWLTPVPVLSS